MGEDDNPVLGVEDLSREEKLKELQVRIMDKVNDMQEKNIPKDVLEGHLSIRRAEDGSGNFELWIEEIDDIQGLQAKIPATKLATISDNEIMYIPENIKQYEEFYKVYDIEDKIPNEYEDIKTLAKLKEREGADQEKTPEEKAQEKEPEEKEEVKEEPEQEKKDDNEQERAPEITEAGDDWIRIGENMQVDAVETVKGEVEKKAGPVADMYIAPNPKDVHDYRLMVKRPGKNTFETIPLSNSKGTNPTTNITTFSENGVETTVSVQMLELNDNRMIAIDYNGITSTNILMVNRTRDNNFIGHEIAGRYKPINMNKPSLEMRQEALGDTPAAKINTDEMQRNINAIKDLPTQNVPDDVDPSRDEDGIAMYEIRNEEDFRKIIIKNIVEEIRDDISGVSEKELYGMATRIAEKLNDGQDYEKAKIEEVLAKEDENREYDPTNRRGI